MNSEKITTIKLYEKTKQRVEKLKEHPRETFDEIIRKTLHILNMTKLDPEQARSMLIKIDEQRKKFPSFKQSKEL